MASSEQLPPPDIMDSSACLRRLVVAVLAGGAAAAIAYFIADSLAKPDDMASSGLHTQGSVGRATGFVWYTTALAGGIVFSIMLAVQNHLAKKTWRAGLVPKAKFN